MNISHGKEGNDEKGDGGTGSSPTTMLPFLE
jgi:hypothetical protein